VLPGTSWIDVVHGTAEARPRSSAFYPYPERPPASPDRLRDVYVSASWRDRTIGRSYRFAELASKASAL
jgi:hypothetical protein